MKIEINEIVAKKILTETKGYLDNGFTHSLNPYSGCTFGCLYCYVRQMPIQTYKDIPWGEWVDIKSNAAENYRNEMIKLRKKAKPVNIFMASATDPYQQIEKKAGITRAILEAMIEHPPDFLQIQTRGPLVTRDIDLLTQLKEKCDVLVSMTIETDSEKIKQIFAPTAPGIILRMKALKEIREAGIPTQASISPFSPEFPQKLKGIADHVWIDTLTIGDGALGKRSEKLGMPQLFNQYGLSKWYSSKLHDITKKHFLTVFDAKQVRVSRDEGFPNK